MRFVLLDESTAQGQAPAFGGVIAPGALAAIAAALNVQLNRDLAVWWGGSYSVRAASSPTNILTGEVACALLDALPNAPGAVAYHDVAGNEVPVVLLARMQCNALTAGSDSVSNALSHELCETAGDPYVNAWRDDGKGAEWAQELCDAVQEANYQVDGITVSDFVLPAFFAPGAPGPYDYLGTLGPGAVTAPLSTMSGGYQLRRTAGGGETQVEGFVGDRRLAKKRNVSSRTYRRGARL